jgi:ABC-type transport system involved in multi-copper enzyme maturation permease subunit
VSSGTTGDYARFSVGRLLALTGATLTQLIRMRILVFLLIFSAVVVAAGFVFPVATPEQQLKLLKDVSFGALQLFSLVIAIVATALLIPRDLEDRTLYTILAKPVPRHEYLLGKLLGVMALVGGGLLVMDLVLSGVLYLRQQMVFQEFVGVLRAEGLETEESLAEVKAIVARQGLTWSLHAGVWAVFLKASVIAALAMMISTFASSTLFTVVCTFCAVIIGHGQQLVRDYFFHGQLTAGWEKAASALLAILAPDLQLFDIVDNVINGEPVTLDSLIYMTGMGLVYWVGYVVVAHLLFVEKEL